LTTEAGHYPLALSSEIARVIHHTVYGWTAPLEGVFKL
jgi:hypothetical protein